MLTLYQIKPAFQRFLRPLVDLLAQWPISPNQITIAALGLASMTGLALAYFPQSSSLLLALPIVLAIRMALNAIDGLLAREYHQTTPLGCVLNELGDVLADAVLYLPFGLIPGIAAPWIVTIVVLAIITEMVGVLAWAMVQQRSYAGPMGKSDRALVFALVALGLGLGLQPSGWLTGVWLGVVGLQVWTIVNRVRVILQEVPPCS
ncbi:CDP-alcohol phosphatidyltransferase family protein [Trichothermofontia sp.]